MQRQGVSAGQVVLIVIAVIILAPFATCMVCTMAVGSSLNAVSAPKLPESAAPTLVERPTAETTPSAPGPANAEPAAQDPSVAAKAAAYTWQYIENKDEMTGQITRAATLLSETTYELGFPYSGGTHSALRVSKHPRHGVTVTVKIDRGQLTCHSFTQCRILVRFDDRPPIKFRGTEPADHSSDLVFLEPESQFLKELRKSKTVAIELPFFQEGQRVFHFDSTDFQWD